MSINKPQRATAGGVRVTIDGTMLNLSADLCTVRRSAKHFTNICPTCEESRDTETDPTQLEQRYVCVEHGHGPFLTGEVAKAREHEGRLVAVAEEARIAAAEPDLPVGVIALSVFPAEQIEAMCRPGDTAYRLRPMKKGGTHLGLYAFLRQVTASGKYAMVGEMNLRGGQKMYRLEVWSGQLVLQSLVRPEDIADVDDVDGEVDEKELTMGFKLLDAVCEEFDPAAFADRRQARIAAAVEAAAASPQTGDAPAEAPVVAPAATDEVLAMLEATLASITKAKPAKKKAPTRKRVAA